MNLLADLGAQPASLMAGVDARTPVALSNYGTIPSTEADPLVLEAFTEGAWKKVKILGVGQAGSSTLAPVEIL